MTLERFAVRRDTAANWTTANPVLVLGEEGVETDTLRRKVGDGSSAWTGLAYATHPPSALDVDMAGVVTPGGSATAAAIAADPALRAALGSADPVLSTFNYDATTGNLLSYQEDGITITLTYNADGTVATSKRGSNATKTYSYSGGNLTGVA